MPITVKIKGSNEDAFPITIEPTQKVLELKQLITTHLGSVTPDAQRLIFAGRVLKDEDSLESYKLQEGSTYFVLIRIHLVKGKPKQPQPTPERELEGQNPASVTPAAATATPAAGGMPGLPPMGGMGAFPGMGMPGMQPGLGDPMQMMNNPMFAQMMSQMLANPQMLDMMINSNPQLASMITPEMRQQMQSPEFRAMLSNPQMIQQMMQMQQMFGGMGGMGGMGAGFNPLNNMYGQPPTSSFTNPYADTPAQPNPMMNPTQPNPMMNPFMNPMMQSMMAGMTPGMPNANTQPTRPPEELYQTQLAQLQEMGFFNPQENVRALQMTGGNVEAAVEWLFSRPG